MTELFLFLYTVCVVVTLDPKNVIMSAAARDEKRQKILPFLMIPDLRERDYLSKGSRMKVYIAVPTSSFSSGSTRYFFCADK